MVKISQSTVFAFQDIRNTISPYFHHPIVPSFLLYEQLVVNPSVIMEKLDMPSNYPVPIPSENWSNLDVTNSLVILYSNKPHVY